MSTEISWHGTMRVTAKVYHGRRAHYVEQTMIDERGHSASMTVHFAGPDAELMAKLFAASINEVDKAFNPPLTMRDILERSTKRTEPV